MGVLDDAIREHLELKRQHGVSEEELRRQEEEALGPARREVAPAESAEDADRAEGVEPEAAEPTAVEDEGLESVVADAPEADTPEPVEADTREPVETDTPGPMEAEAPETSEVEGTAVELPAEGPQAPAPFDADADIPPSREEEPAEGTPPRGFEQLDEDDEPAGEETGDADVLEDTPDFLQETPEHDRLWFEQKPPRDFDFD
jgi:hypothetical protein